MNNYKPSGYNSVSPYLIVNGAQRLVDMLSKVFGAKELRRFDRPDGLIMHVEIQIDDSVLMISDATEEFPQNNTLLHIYVKDVDETYRLALANGCTADKAPERMEGDPDKRGMFIDFAGNTWAIGTQVEDI